MPTGEEEYYNRAVPPYLEPNAPPPRTGLPQLRPPPKYVSPRIYPRRGSNPDEVISNVDPIMDSVRGCLHNSGPDPNFVSFLWANCIYAYRRLGCQDDSTGSIFNFPMVCPRMAQRMKERGPPPELAALEKRLADQCSPPKEADMDWCVTMLNEVVWVHPDFCKIQTQSCPDLNR